MSYPINPAIARPIGVEWSLHHVLPLLRHLIPALVLLGAGLHLISVRLEVQSLSRDLDRQVSMRQEAQVLHERLLLEHDTRRRLIALEASATALGVSASAGFVRP